MTVATISGILTTVDPLLMRHLIDKVLPAHSIANCLELVAAIAGCYLGRHLFLGWSRSVDFSVEQNLAQELRLSLLEQLNRLSPEYHEQTPVGEKLKRLESDVDQIAEFGSEFTSSVVRSIVFFVVNVVVMFSLSIRMTTALLPILGMFAWIWIVYRPRLMQLSEQARTQTGRASSVLLEFLSAQPQIQLLCSQKLVENKAATIWTHLVSARQTYRQAEIRFMVLVGSTFVLGNLLVLLVGSLQVLQGSLTIGSLVAFYGFNSRAFEPVNAFLDIYTRMQRVGAGIRQVRSVLESQPAIADVGSIAEPLSTVAQGIALKQLTFAYTPDHDALRCFNLVIHPRDRLGIVGPSGSGKSTVARLLTRMSEPGRGIILLDGHPLSEYKLDALRHTISYVPQQPVLFQGTIRDNLFYGNPTASAEDINQVISVTQLGSVLRRLSAGIDAELGTYGHGLSGGELQRIALARALLRRSPVVVLDESTSALDLVTEERILRSVAEFCSDSILIIISHRLASISWMNRIVVLNAGRIVDIGDHDDLFATSVLYRKLYVTTVPPIN
jgi:ABC-type bacteriocin/lantibiotic exporter with double-glycine peptidase domain